MAKKNKEKTIWKNLKTYFLVMVVGFGVYLIVGFITKPAPLCANSKSCKSDLVEKVENGSVGMFQGHKIIAPNINLALRNTNSSVLGASVPSTEKHIYVDLSTQILYAYEGTNKVFETFVSTGRWNKTPVGNFNIWEKLRSTRMAGGEGDAAYDLPNVPFVMYFYNDFGTHGAYWHDNFGHTMSHGCVNLRQVDAEALYNWADGPTIGNDGKKMKGTAVSICDSVTNPSNCVQTNPIN